MRKAVFLLLASLCLPGCSMAPSYTRPALPVENAWPRMAGVPGEEGEAPRLPGWEEFFPDSGLRGLIALALENNRDLRVSAANMRRARALYRIERAAQLPAVQGTGENANRRIPAVLTQTPDHRISRESAVDIGLSSFEIDFFGRLQSLKEEALETFLASEEAYRSACISLVAEVVLARLTLAADEESLAISRATLESQEETYKMIERRFDLGVSSRLQLSEARTSVEAARVNIARYAHQVEADRLALALVVGAPVPPELIQEKSMTAFVLPDELPVGLPSETLLKRPDILQAEHALKAANANIGAARANFFPRIALTATLGYASDELSDLFSNATRTWSFLPRVTLPIFEWGANVARLGVSEADRDIAVARYEKAVQQAFSEVADALVLRRTIVDQLSAQRALVGAAVTAYDLSAARFEKGVDSFLQVLDSQRYMYAAQLDLVTVRLQQEANRVALYRALGGGWPDAASEAVAQSPAGAALPDTPAEG